MADSKIVGNYFIAKNEVFVEGRSIGQFTEFSTDDSRDNIFGTAEVVMPFYTILQNEDNASSSVGKNVKSYIRIDQKDSQIVMGARITVKLRYVCGYNGYELPEVTAFDGYVKEVICGFPTKIRCEDGAFVLRFGTINKSWTSATPVKTMMQEIIDVANEKFQEYRDNTNLTAEWNNLSVDPLSFDGEFVLSTWRGISPFFALERVLDMYRLYARVDNYGKLYCGVGISQNDKNTIALSTAVNVVNRDISTENGFFDKYRVIVKYINQGQLYEYETGADNGEVVSLPLVKCQGADAARRIGDSALSGLRSNNNKGTIEILLYPEVQLFDYIEYEDTLFPQLSGGFYVIGHSYKCGAEGYRQRLTVTNKALIYT